MLRRLNLSVHAFVKVGTEKIFFDLVKNLELVPFSEDYDQDVRVVRML